MKYFLFQAEVGIRYLVRSRGLGDVYKRHYYSMFWDNGGAATEVIDGTTGAGIGDGHFRCEDACLLYTSDAADERSSVDLGGRRIIKKKTSSNNSADWHHLRKSRRTSAS